MKFEEIEEKSIKGVYGQTGGLQVIKIAHPEPKLR